MEPYKISVIVPVYKTEQYLPRCLDSILHNTYKNLEIICVNDGSPDNSIEILNQYAERDSRIQVIDKKNEGVSVARNTALNRASGEFIAFIDSDDWVHPQYFETMMWYQKNFSADIVICEALKTENDMVSYLNIVPCKANGKLINIDEVINHYDAKRYVWGRIYSKKIIQGMEFEKGLTVGEDTVFNLEAICKNRCERVCLISETLYYYFQRASSTIHTVPHTAVFGMCQCYIRDISLLQDEKTRNIFMTEALKICLSYRYLKTYSLDKDRVKSDCREIFSQCIKQIKAAKELSLKEKLKCYILIYIPIVYRVFRIINDPTMLDWEKSEKRKRKGRQNDS